MSAALQAAPSRSWSWTPPPKGPAPHSWAAASQLGRGCSTWCRRTPGLAQRRQRAPPGRWWAARWRQVRGARFAGRQWGVRPGHSAVGCADRHLRPSGTLSDCMCCAVLSSHEPQVSSLRTLSLGTGSGCCASSRRRRPGLSGSWLIEAAARVLKEAFPASLLKRSLYLWSACDPCCGQALHCAMLPSAHHPTHLASR